MANTKRVIVVTLLTLLTIGGWCVDPGESLDAAGKAVRLTAPTTRGLMSIEEALAERRSRRTYAGRALTREQVSQLLWAAQGITERGTGYRTAPSAGGLYPLELYILARRVMRLEPGLYRYDPVKHRLMLRAGWVRQSKLTEAALGQAAVAEAPAVMVVTAVYQRTERKYGRRAARYVHMELGAAVQNIYLQAESLGLGTVFIGAFRDQEVKAALSLPKAHAPLALVPVGARTAP